MFLERVSLDNSKLIEAAFSLHQKGDILPDTYVIDMDQLRINAKKMIEVANTQNIELYFMLKQVGRNPRIAKELMEIGYAGAVVVDFKEAQVMMKHNVPIANVGHLVQPPKQIIQQLVDYGCANFTVFSLEKLKVINECAKKSGIIQKVLLKVVGKNDLIYSGQEAGFLLEELAVLTEELKQLENIKVDGVTSFPCFLYDKNMEDILPTPNMETLLNAKKILEDAGIEIHNINAPSTTSVETLTLMKNYPIDSGEPGHGLTGTTPLHAYKECVEKTSVIYVSEVSHNFKGLGYCYGGGFYRRSYIKNAYVGKNLDLKKQVEVIPPALESIDYYFGLDEECDIHDTVIMAFRFQIFVTRSNVCLIDGIQENNPRVIGVYSSQGELI